MIMSDIDIEIEDYLHFIQGGGGAVTLDKVSIQQVDFNSQTVPHKSISIDILFKVILRYEIGCEVSLYLAYCGQEVTGGLYKPLDIISAIKNGEFQYAETHRNLSRRASDNHAIRITNPQLGREFDKIYPNKRPFSDTDVFRWVSDDMKAESFMQEYKMALALKPHKLSDFFDETLRVALDKEVRQKAIAELGL